MIIKVMVLTIVMTQGNSTMVMVTPFETVEQCTAAGKAVAVEAAQNDNKVGNWELKQLQCDAGKMDAEKFYQGQES